MKATGNFDLVKDVDPAGRAERGTRASTSTTGLAKFPPDRSARRLIQALMAAQEQNGGWLTDVLIAAVAKYLGMPPVWAYEVATFYSMFETAPVGAQQRRHLHQHLVLAQRCRGHRAALREEARHHGWAKAAPTAASISSRKKSASPPAAARR